MALPTPGGPGEFPRLVSQTVSGNFLQGAPLVVPVLWAARWKIGRLLRWDGADTGLGSGVPTLRDRFPTDLRGAPTGPDFDTLPFRVGLVYTQPYGPRNIHATSVRGTPMRLPNTATHLPPLAHP